MRSCCRRQRGERPAWRSDLLVEYYGLGNVVRYEHLEDTYNNTFRALRSMDFSAGHDYGATSNGSAAAFKNVLYAEFTDIKLDYNFTSKPQEFELFDLDADPFALHNAYSEAPTELKTELASRLLKLFGCQGSPDAAGSPQTCN